MNEIVQRFGVDFSYFVGCWGCDKSVDSTLCDKSTTRWTDELFDYVEQGDSKTR